MWSIIVAAGWPIWPLIFTSVAGLAVILERIWFLRKTQIAPKGLTDDVLKSVSQFKEGSNLARLKQHSALGSVLAGGLSAYFKAQDHSDAMVNQGLEVKGQLEKHLDILALIATAAPLMGLLGTVVGMIEIFAVQGQTVQSPEALASGIAVALYNTAFGLIVAIPALIAHRLFKIRINNLLDSLEQAARPLEQALSSQKSRQTGRG